MAGMGVFFPKPLLKLITYCYTVIRMEYYDKILLGMFASLLMGAVTGVLTSLPLNLTTAVGSLVAGGMMYHGMFYNTPVMAQDGL
jgi:hypothetical protein